MRNLKKIIAVVVTLVMLFAVASVSVSAAAAPVFSLRGATEVSLTEAAADGESAQYYELAVHLEDADKTVGAIEGVITYDPAVFTYKETALGAALKADAANTVENTVDATEAGKVKFVGLSTEAGVWFVLRFSIVAEGSADFALEAKAANRTGTAYLNVTVNGASTTIVDENMISMEGGAILKNTVGLPNPKNVLTGENYTGDKNGMDAKELTPKTAVTSMPVWNKGLLEGVEFTNSGEETQEIKFSYRATESIYTGGTELLYYVEVPEGEKVEFELRANFSEYITVDGETQKYTFIGNNYDANFLLLKDGETEWKTLEANKYKLELEEGFKGIIRVPYKNLAYTGSGPTAGIRKPSSNASPYELHVYFSNVTPGTTVLSSYPWIVAECTAEYDPYVVNVGAKSEYSEPTQDLTFNVVVDEDLVAAAEAQYGEVVEMGTLLMYTKRLNYRELKIDMADKTGLVTASKAYAADEAVESFTVNLNNIKWSAMGVSVSARAYIEFANGTVIYSKNYSNEFETNAGNARESVIGVAVDAVKAGDFDAAKATDLGYDVAAIQAIANQTSIAGQDRKDLLNFIADCYKQN